MRPFGRHFIITGLVLTGSLGAMASDDPSDPTDLVSFVDLDEPELLTPLDPRVGDVSPLSQSLRVEYPGLEKPSAFSAVYRVPGDPSKMMRVNGGLRAIFTQSVYQPSAYGSFPMIPPSTVFQIGDPAVVPTVVRAPETEATEPLEFDGLTRAGFGYISESASESPDRATDSTELPRFISDADYRRRRLDQILRAHMKSGS